MKNTITNKNRYLFFLFLLISSLNFGQCDPNVPLYVIDLSANADTTWTLFEADADDREGQCCSADPNENCIQFQISLNGNTAGIYFDYDGAGAYGALNWQIDCGPEYNLKDTICIVGGGTFLLTFCKPGTDNGNYTLMSVPLPTFPEDQFVPLNCSQPVEAMGVTPNSIVWQSISPGAPGDYDSLMSCTNCLDPVYTPDPNGPSVVEYEVCGYPLLDYCVGSVIFCDTVSFTSQDSILLSISPENPAFCAGDSVQLTALATGGDGNFSYFWYDNALNLIDTTSTLSVSVAGSYTCEVRDGNYDPFYCDNFSQTIIVTETQPPTVNAGPDQFLCADEPIADLIGSVQLASGGIWSGGSGTYESSNTDLTLSYTPTQTEIASGSVVLTLTSTGAGSGCSNTYDNVEIFFIDTIQTDLTDLTLQCSYSMELISPTVSGGMAPFSYSWSNGLTTLENSLGTGTHCLTITGSYGCQVTECFTISSPPELNVTTSSTPATTNGGSDGTATVTPSGGTSPYSYLWNTSGTNQTETGLSYGLYTVMVTDANGCSHDASVVVNEPRCGGYYINTNSSAVLCNGGNTGTATVIPVNGTAPYVYSWNDPSSQSTASAVNLPFGVYEVIVTDSAGCIAVSTANVFQPNALNNTMTHTDVTSVGGNDGSAQSNAVGGTPPYSYVWSTTETTSGISNLSLGTYYVEITDANGCTLNDSVFINEPECNEFNVFIATVSPSCNGDSTGEATLSIINGSMPYSILWSTGETNVMSISGLPAGIFSVEVTDSSGCYTYTSFGISEPSPLSIGLIPTPSTCAGSNNGTIDVSVIGGNYPIYSYSWNNASTTEDQINLSPGMYNVTVTDMLGCTTTAQTTLVDPSPLTITYTSQDVSCYGGTDAFIDITVSGGSAPYNFDWSNGQTTEDLSGIDIGGYILELTDGNFCSPDFPLTVIINQPEQLNVSVLTTEVSCNGTNDGAIDITPSGGTLPYNYQWSNGATTEDLSDLAGGIYSLTLTDANNCQIVTDVTLIESTPMNATMDITNISCFNFADGAIDLTVIGGTAPYTYEWSNPGDDSQDVSNLSAGIHDVTITDFYGCTINASGEVLEPEELELNAKIGNNTCFQSADGFVDISASGGTMPYIYNWSTGISDEDLTMLESGAYDVTVTDNNGCEISLAFLITEPDSLYMTLTSPVNAQGYNVSLFGGSDGSINATVYGGTNPYSYDWSNGANTEDLFGLQAGFYSCTVTDAEGCTTTRSIIITQPMDLELPSAFSPNDDGSNDFYVIHGIDVYPDNTLMVFNRWGNKVFEKDAYNNTWQGLDMNDNLLPDGVYFVLLEINSGDIKKDTYVHIKTH